MKNKKMLTEIGINACIDKLGREFVQKYAASSSSSYGETEDGMFCFVGVNDQPEDLSSDSNIALDGSQFPYRVSCIVNHEGVIAFKECVLPQCFG